MDTAQGSHKKAAVVHDLASSMVHRQVFLLAVHSPSASPGARARFQQLADRYDVLCRSIAAAPSDPGTGDPGIVWDDMTARADFPTLDDMSRLVDWKPYKEEGQVTWTLALVDSQFQPLPGTQITAVELWDFCQKITAKYKTLPQGLIAWASYAHKGDKAVFYQTADKTLYHVSVK